MKYQAYPEYKDSGVEWLVEVPKHWGVSKLKYLANQIVDGAHFTPTYVNSGIPFLRVTDVHNKEIDKGNIKYIPESEHLDLIKRCNPKKGDLLLSKNGTIGLPKVVDWDWEFSIFVSLCLIKLNEKLDVNYVDYFFRTHEIREQIFGQIKQSTVINLHLDKIERFELTLPPLNEQLIVINFLNHETAKIDNLIDQQQQLIKLLKEKRQAVISHAVTKGLNPQAPMKDSGVGWLGDVPEHWVVAQLKFNTLSMQTGPFGSQLHAEDYVENGIPLINPAHMIDGEIVPDAKITVDSATHERLGRHKLASGDIIFARRGELGRCAIVKSSQTDWLCGTGSLKAKLNSRLLPEYAYLLITSEGVVSELSLESKGSTMDNLNTETLGRVRMPVPPEKEQKDILEYVDGVSGKYELLINKAVRSTQLMQERRTTLISAAVTGKIDVRNWQAPPTTYLTSEITT